jgi:hypothetical protein
MDAVSKSFADSSKVATRRVYGRPFKPGQSGNPGGRKKKPITELMERIVKKKANRDEIEEVIMEVIRSKRMASVLMLKEVAERTDGKVTDELEITGAISTYSDEELLAKLKKLTSK